MFMWLNNGVEKTKQSNFLLETLKMVLILSDTRSGPIVILFKFNEVTGLSLRTNFMGLIVIRISKLHQYGQSLINFSCIVILNNGQLYLWHLMKMHCINPLWNFSHQYGIKHDFLLACLEWSIWSLIEVVTHVPPSDPLKFEEWPRPFSSSAQGKSAFKPPNDPLKLRNELDHSPWQLKESGVNTKDWSLFHGGWFLISC